MTFEKEAVNDYCGQFWAGRLAGRTDYGVPMVPKRNISLLLLLKN